MDRTSDWHKIDDVFARALDVAPEERAAFLDGVCADAPDLRAAVERLLSSAETGGDLLQTGWVLEGDLLPPEDEPRPPDDLRVGAFRVLDEIGRGGMGVVYRAERVDGEFEQRVALKLLKHATDSPSKRLRFTQERQILATLDHPNIARLLDGGVSSDGRPYFALELVDGRPIDRYCDEERLTISERLRLFVDVGRAVESAHRKLVVHRDIKPSNVLVDREGRVKLLDFGIAKLLEPGAWQTPETRTIAPPLTPAYASPEQVRGETITTASDVYQLGLLLYELLTGLRPYRTDTHSPAGWVHAICQEEPTRPSAAVAATTSGTGRGPRSLDPSPTKPRMPGTTTALAIAAARRIPPRRLRRLLSGDLDTIVLKALRKEPDKRYASVGQLVEDVERTLDGRPVSARKGTFAYRTGKFARRHAAVVSSLALALVTVAALVVFYTARLAAERDRATLQARRAERVSELLVGLFEGSDPYLPSGLATGPDTTARELLDRGAERLTDELAGEPRVRAGMMEVIGDVYRKIALYDAARPLLETALASRLELQGEEHPDTATSRFLLGQLELQSGDYAGARHLFERALATRERDLGADHPQTLATLVALADAHRKLSELDEARTLYEEVLAHQELSAGTDPLELAETLDAYGQLLRTLRAYDEAIGAHRRALEIRERVLGPEHPRVGQTLRQLGMAVRYAEDAAAGLPYLERSAAILEKSLGPRHPVLADALAGLGLALREEERFDEAEEVFQRAFEIRRDALGESHTLVADSLSHLALNARSTGRFERARELFEHTLAIEEEVLGQDHGNLAYTLTGYAELLDRDLGDAEAALPLYRRVVELRVANLGEDHSFVGMALHNLTRLLVQEGRYGEALPLLEKGLANCRTSHKPGHWVTINLLFGLTESLTALERYPEAEPYALEAWELFQQSSYFEAAKAGGARLLVELYESWGKPSQAALYRVHLEPSS